MRAARGLWQGILAGPAFGACVGLADCVAAALRGGTVLTPGHWLPVVGIYAAAWLPLGILAGFAGGLLFRRAERAAALLLFTGSLLFFVGAFVNVEVLPSFTAPASLVFDAVLLAAGVVAFLALFLLPVPVLAPRIRPWLAILLVPFAVAAAAPILAGGEAEEAVAVESEAAEPPNVLVFLVDALRRDHLGAYGYERDTSPCFDAFAERAVRFDACRAASTWTKPSTASIFTGLLPTAHGAVEHRDVLSRRATTMAEVFRAAGYSTAAFSDNPFVSPEFGFDQGFATYDYEAPSVFVNGTLLGKALWTLRVVSMTGELFGESLVEYRGSETLCRRLLHWLDGLPPGRPWFAYLHAMEPHLPYDPPAPARGTFADGAYQGPDLDRPPRYLGFLPFEPAPPLPPEERRHLVDRYDEEILTWDAEFGSLLAELSRRGLEEGTIVVVLSDHGEEFYEHRGWTHGHSLYEELLRVPLAIRAPGLPAGVRREPVSTTDLAATLFELAGIRPVAPWRGAGLLEVREGATVSEVRMGGASAACIVLDGKKLVVSHRGDDEVREAFDLARDPRETNGRDLPDWAATHEMALRALLGAAEALALDSDARELSPREEEVLRGLGYTR